MVPPSQLPRILALGPFTVAQASSFGVGISRTRCKDLERPFHGVRAGVDTLETLTDRCKALDARMPQNQFFSHTTSAMIYGLPLPRRLVADLTIHVTAIHPNRAPRLAGVTGHTVTAGSPDVRIHDGIRVLSPAATWCQLAPMLSLDELIAAGDRLLGLPIPLADSAEIERAVRAYGHRRGARRLRAAVGWLRSGVESPRETWLRLTLVRAGLPEPVPNETIRFATPGAADRRGDLVYRKYRVLVEYDGGQHRLDPRQFDKDVTQLNDFSAEEWIVIRVNKHTTAAEAISRTRDALLGRGWRP